MFEFGEEFPFIEDGMDAFLGNDFGFVHFLHGVEFVVFFHFDAPNFSESPLPNNVVKVEAAPVGLLILLIKFALFVNHNFVFPLFLLLPHQFR